MWEVSWRKLISGKALLIHEAQDRYGPLSMAGLGCLRVTPGLHMIPCSYLGAMTGQDLGQESTLLRMRKKGIRLDLDVAGLLH